MRTRYQTNPKIAVVGIILSLGLILGAHEAMSAKTTAQKPEAHNTGPTEPLGVGMVDVSPMEVDEGPAEKSC